MSCHDIGRGLDSVTETVYDLYVENKISLDVTKILIKKIQKAVHYCDGNEYEAVEILWYNKICSSCFMKYDEIYDIYSEIPDNYEMKKNPEYVNSYMCKECSKKLLSTVIKDEKKLQNVIDNLKPFEI